MKEILLSWTTGESVSAKEGKNMRNLQGFLDDLRDGNMQFARHPEWYDFTEDECTITERMFSEMDYLPRLLDHQKRRNRALRVSIHAPARGAT